MLEQFSADLFGVIPIGHDDTRNTHFAGRFILTSLHICFNRSRCIWIGGSCLRHHPRMVKRTPAVGWIGGLGVAAVLAASVTVGGALIYGRRSRSPNAGSAGGADS